MLVLLKRALSHGWEIHSHDKRGVFLNLRGNFVLLIDWSGYVEYRGSRLKCGRPLITA